MHNSVEPHTVSAKVGEGSGRGGLAPGQGRQEGGGGGSILRPLEDLASANLGGRASAPRVRRETGTPAICRLEAWPDGTTEARGGSLLHRHSMARSSRRGQASGSPAPRGPWRRRHAQVAPCTGARGSGDSTELRGRA